MGLIKDANWTRRQRNGRTPIWVAHIEVIGTWYECCVLRHYVVPTLMKVNL
jgi:hypothetical protein